MKETRERIYVPFTEQQIDDILSAISIANISPRSVDSPGFRGSLKRISEKLWKELRASREKKLKPGAGWVMNER